MIGSGVNIWQGQMSEGVFNPFPDTATFHDFTKNISYTTSGTLETNDEFWTVSSDAQFVLNSNNGLYNATGSNEMPRSGDGASVYEGFTSLLPVNQDFSDPAWTKDTITITNTTIDNGLGGTYRKVQRQTTSGDRIHESIGKAGSSLLFSAFVPLDTSDVGISDFYAIQFRGATSSDTADYCYQYSTDSFTVQSDDGNFTNDLALSSVYGNSVILFMKFTSDAAATLLTLIAPRSTSEKYNSPDPSTDAYQNVGPIQLVQSDKFFPHAGETTGAAITIAATNVSCATADLGFGSSGMFIVDLDVTETDTFPRIARMFTDISNRLEFYKSSSILRLEHIIGGVSSDTTVGTLVEGEALKVALGWTGNEFKASLNGGAIVTIPTADGNPFTPFNTFYLLNTGGGNQWNDKIRFLKTYPEYDPETMIFGTSPDTPASFYEYDTLSDYQADQFYQDFGGVATDIDAEYTVVRSGKKYIRNIDGSYNEVQANEASLSDRGLIVEEGFTSLLEENNTKDWIHQSASFSETTTIPTGLGVNYSKEVRGSGVAFSGVFAVITKGSSSFDYSIEYDLSHLDVGRSDFVGIQISTGAGAEALRYCYQHSTDTFTIVPSDTAFTKISQKTVVYDDRTLVRLVFNSSADTTLLVSLVARTTSGTEAATDPSSTAYQLAAPVQLVQSDKFFEHAGETTGSAIVVGAESVTKPTEELELYGEYGNDLSYSEQFDHTDWFKQSTGAGSIPTVTDNSALAPDGTMTAARVQFSIGSDVTGDRSMLRQSVTTSTGATLAIYVKSNTGTNQEINIHLAGAAQSRLAVTNEWQRVDDYQGSGIAGNWGLELRGDTGGNGDLASDILVWGAQLEESSILHPYVKTEASSVIVPSSGMMVFDFDVPEDNGGSQYLFSMDDGTSSSRLQLRTETGTTNLVLTHYVAGASGVNISGATVGLHKIAIGWDGATIYYSLDGGAIGSLPTQDAGAFVAQIVFNLGQRYSGTSQLNSVIRNFQTFQTWNTAQAQILTLGASAPVEDSVISTGFWLDGKQWNDGQVWVD